MKFRGFPRPVYDETFTSWVSRCGDNRKINFSSLMGILVSERIVGNRIVCEDPDFDFESQFFLAASRLINVSASLLRLSFSPRSAWILPWHQRKYYCPDCLVDDVCKKRNPSWRKAWCYAATSHCEVHNKQLIELPGLVSPSKAWDAFTSHVNLNNLPPPNRTSKWMSDNATKLRYLLQRKALRVFNVNLMSPGNSRRKTDVFPCFKVVAQILLMPRTLITSKGLARHLYSDGRARIDRTLKNYPDALEIGSLESTAHERMCAVILSGFVFSIYSDRELEVAKRVYMYAGYHFPDDKYLLGFWAVSTGCARDYLYVKSLFCNFPKKTLRKVKRFIDGIDAANKGKAF